MRKGLIAIIVIILAVVGYVAGVVTTKKATYEAVEVMVEELERNSQFIVAVDWQEEGSRDATVVVRVEMKGIPEFDFPIHYEETIQLSYGFLNTKWAGSGDIFIEDRKISDVLYNGNPFTSSGVVSRGGMQVTYDFPILSVIEDGFSVQAEPMQAQFVLAGEERRFNFIAPELTVRGDDNDGLTLTSLMMNSDSRMLDGEIFSSSSQMSLAGAELNFPDVAPITITGIYSTLNTLRADDEMRMNGTFAVESVDAGPAVKGNANIDWAVEGFKYQEFKDLNEALQNHELSEEEMAERVFSAVIASEDVLFRLNELLVVGEGWGSLRSHGTVGMDLSSLQDSQKMDLLGSGELLNYFDVNLVIEEMPGMLQMMMMAFTSDDLPWNLRYSKGDVYLNDELVDLDGMQ